MLVPIVAHRAVWSELMLFPSSRIQLDGIQLILGTHCLAQCAWHTVTLNVDGMKVFQRQI